MVLEVEGIVIKQVPYKEKDAMVSVLTKDGTVSFLARGILNPTSKNASSCLLFAYSSFTLNSRQDKLTLTQGKLIKSYYHLYESLEKMAAIQLICELIIKCLDEENGNIYPYLFKMLDLLSNDFDSRTLSLICIANIIKESGYALEYDECVNCGNKKNIVSYSLSQGGFICCKCLKLESELKSPEMLKTFRYIFKVTPDLMDHYVLNKKLSLDLIKDLSEYLKDCFSIKEIKALEIYFSSLN
jgi:DNA repair protein RecO (recombination protein O)